MTTQTTKSPQFANKAPQLVGKHPDTRHGVILYVEDVNLSFDGFKALNNLNLYINKGELRCLIGANGAGKTTLMDLSLVDGLAIGNGVITVENEAQAWIRADVNRKDKGGDAARAAMAMAVLKQAFCS